MTATTRLTSTSYAVLGVLAAEPRTAYELIGELERTTARFLPRAASKLYEEPKRLVGAGLARATDEHVGRRRRTRYRITPKGRQALTAWLAAPGAAPVLECEQLLQVHLAERGTRADLLATVAALGAWARDQEGRGDRLDPIGGEDLTGRFLADFALMVAGWAEWAAATVTARPADAPAAGDA
jgi:DNA-binding PadR family transcriptional regulator